jgi:hypothetical protein
MEGGALRRLTNVRQASAERGDPRALSRALRELQG